MNTPEFVLLASAEHLFAYTYDKVEYISSQDKVIVSCDTHGDFMIAPAEHLRGKGCRRCAALNSGMKRSLGKSGFIDRSVSVHGEKYSYESVEYKNNKTPVKIWCNMHSGYFMQLPSHHLNGSGCRECCSTISSSVKSGYIYLLTSKCKNHIKVGVTTNPKERFRQLKNSTPFEFDVSECIRIYNENGIGETEKSIHAIIGLKRNFKNFDGATEWFAAISCFDKNLLVKLMRGNHAKHSR